MTITARITIINEKSTATGNDSYYRYDYTMAGLAVVSAELVVVMVEPTWGSARYPKLKTFYEPIASKKAHNKALVATMGKTLMEKKYKKLIRLSSHPT